MKKTTHTSSKKLKRSSKSASVKTEDRTENSKNIIEPLEIDLQSNQTVQRTFNESHPYYHILNQVVDPETGIGIADMGIIYNIKDEDGILDVTMTLTSMGCPAGPQITTDIDGVLRLQPHVKDVQIQIVWDPPWTPDMMNPEIRAMLFGGF